MNNEPEKQKIVQLFEGAWPLAEAAYYEIQFSILVKMPALYEEMGERKKAKKFLKIALAEAELWEDEELIASFKELQKKIKMAEKAEKEATA